MNDQLVETFVMGVSSLALVVLMMAAAAHIVGGAKWSGAVLRFAVRAVRWSVGSVILLVAQILGWIGKTIKGGGKNPVSAGSGGGSRRPAPAAPPPAPSAP